MLEPSRNLPGKEKQCCEAAPIEELPILLPPWSQPHLLPSTNSLWLEVTYSPQHLPICLLPLLLRCHQSPSYYLLPGEEGCCSFDFHLIVGTSVVLNSAMGVKRFFSPPASLIGGFVLDLLSKNFWNLSCRKNLELNIWTLHPVCIMDGSDSEL